MPALKEETSRIADKFVWLLCQSWMPRPNLPNSIHKYRNSEERCKYTSKLYTAFLMAHSAVNYIKEKAT